ncbi:carbonic anhydrase [Cytidiella melzeri]|nr:carbonic anhydrase [Cytidiella melzeri]
MSVMQDFPILARFLENNVRWANGTADEQEPKVLWIGCADSRVPETVILGCGPGDIFVTRNIANQVHVDDDSILSVLKYAILTLGVEHVIVVGHTKCGGVKACLDPNADLAPSLTRWLAPLTSEAAKLEKVLGRKPEERELVEANVRLGVQNVLRTDAVKNAWNGVVEKRENANLLGVHGMVYELDTRLLKDLEVSVIASSE